MKRSLLKGSRGPKGRRSGGRRRCSGGGGGGVCFGGVFGVKGGINEREGAGRGRRSAGQERHGSEAALLGAGEASEEVTMDVVLSRCNGGGVGGCVCVVVVECFGLQLSINISSGTWRPPLPASRHRSMFKLPLSLPPEVCEDTMFLLLLVHASVEACLAGVRSLQRLPGQ